jgi:hypothetical protein
LYTNTDKNIFIKRKSLKNKKKKKAEPPVSVIVDNPKRDMLALFFTALSLLALAIEHRSFVTSSTVSSSFLFPSSVCSSQVKVVVVAAVSSSHFR